MHARLPARGDPDEGLRAGAARRTRRTASRASRGAARTCRASSWRSPSRRSTAPAASSARPPVPPSRRRSRSHRSLEMRPAEDEQKRALAGWDFFRSLPELDRTLVEPASIKGSQLLEPLFEFSGACSGCGETPYLKLLTQLVGDRLVVANATGCSSIYGGNLPTTPWARNADGRGPAWANSLFEDNAEFGLGLRLSLDQQRREALDAPRAGSTCPASLKEGLREPQPDEAAVQRARGLVEELKSLLAEREDAGSAPARPARGRPRREERLARRRRRLGLRHRLRRPRPRARLRPQRQGARAGHRGLLEHGRPGLEGDPARRGREVRLRRQANPQEGSRPDRDGLRRRLRRPDRARRRQRPGRDAHCGRPSSIPARRS